MAIAKIKKIELIALQEDRDRILALLQQGGQVELINIRQEEIAQPSTLEEETNLVEMQEAIAYLGSYEKEQGFLKGMIKPLIYQQQLKEVISTFDYTGRLKELVKLRNHIRNLVQHKERLIQEKQHLSAWRNLDLPLEELYPSRNCASLSGVLRTKDYSNLWKASQGLKLNLFCDIVEQNSTNTYILIIYLQEEFEQLEALLKNHHFNFITLGLHKGRVKDRIEEINRENMVLVDQIQDTQQQIAVLSRARFKLMMVYDYLSNIKNIREADKNLAKQKFTFTLSGWIKLKDAALLEKEMARNFRDAAIFISDPQEGESIPVILENKRIIQPFEFITQIYGMPKYNELDPTPFLAPFFFLYFGLCVSDVGYGLVLVIISFFALKRFKMGPQGKKFWTLFFYCGISTIIIGALTGSWFGNLFDILGEGHKIFLPVKKFKDSLVVLDPLKEPTKLLGIALIFGIIQVWFGNIVAAIGNIKNRRYIDIALDQVPMLWFLFGLTGLGLIFLRLLDNCHIDLFKYAALSAGIALLLTQGRAQKNLGAKLFYGAFNLYSAISGYLSDILSYSRLWALGLVTSVMAMTINLISMQFSGILTATIPFVNKISSLKAIVSACVLIIIFVLGHLVSFLMNLLGAFVHTVRLQFVEFFSKFFKSTGEAFEPFRIETKYIHLE